MNFVVVLSHSVLCLATLEGWDGHEMNDHP